MTGHAGRCADLYRHHDVYARFPAEHRVAGSLGVQFTRARQGDFEATDPAVPDFLLGVALGRQEGTLEVDFGEGRRRFEHAVGASYLNPTAGEADYRQVGRMDLVFLAAPMAALARGLEVQEVTLWAALRPLHDVVGLDRRLRAQVLELWDHAARAGPFAALAVDHGVLSLAALLVERARPGEGRLPEPPPRLDDERLRRVVDHVEDRLAEPMRLADLAAVACLSPHHFLRAFRRATGRTPAAYVAQRRIERARALLAGPLPLAEVGFACGFASQPHFTRVFKSHTGATPGAYRRKVAG